MQALRKVLSLFPSFLSMKIYIEGAAILWSLIPIYGIIQGIRHRLYWAMASNVLVFEGLSGGVGRKRCRELIEDFSGGIAARTLVTVPSLLMAGLFVAWAIGGAIFETFYSYGFWVLIAAIFGIIIPVSGAANTFFYLEMTGKDRERSAQPSMKSTAR